MNENNLAFFAVGAGIGFIVGAGMAIAVMIVGEFKKIRK